jgi:hypothetical protein
MTMSRVSTTKPTGYSGMVVEVTVKGTFSPSAEAKKVEYV